MNTELMFSSKSDMWATPQKFFEELDMEFHFTVDVCAVKENAKCRRFFSPEVDGLKQEWSGVCWCNPPYGRQIGKWVQKAAEAKCTVVMLLPARTDTKWFHEYIYGKAEIRFVKGRLRFGGGAQSAPFPSMVVIFRRELTDYEIIAGNVHYVPAVSDMQLIINKLAMYENTGLEPEEIEKIVSERKKTEEETT